MHKAKLVVTLPNDVLYDVRVSSGLLDTFGEQLRSYAATASSAQILLIVDQHVAPYYKMRVKNSLTAVGYQVSDIEVPGGEDAKTTEVLCEVWRAMAQLKLGRDCVVVALGGGAVCDLSGFVAGTYMRGVACVYIPTTVLSMVDASVGGKTAVNLPEGKNLVGVFSQPAYVCSDLSTLATLPQVEWASGYAEVAKAAILESDEFFFWMLDHASALQNHDLETVCEAVVRSVSFKAGVVARDEHEMAGVRECLNYGHTYGHAVEKLTGYGKYSHGVAVAEGMRFAALLSCRLGLMSADAAQAQNELLDALDLPALSWRGQPHEVLAVMQGDKKTRGGQVRFVLLHDVGAWEVIPVAEADILAALESF